MAMLSDAHREWANRPDDERFRTLDELRDVCKREQEESKELPAIPRRELEAYSQGDDIRLATVGGHTMDVDRLAFNNWSFNQTCSLAKAPGAYLAGLPGPLAASCLNDGLRKAEGDACQLVRNGTLRAVTSERYGRFWSLYLVEACLRAQSAGWVIPPAMGPKPAGIYHGDRDTFVFMVDSPEASYLVRDTRGDRTEALHRGFFWQNSEVGARRYEICTFWMNGVCGNHYVWGASGVTRVAFRHVGDQLARRIPETFRRVLEATKQGADDDLAGIRLAMDDVLGLKREDAVKVAVAKTDLPKRTIESAWDLGKAEGSDPSTAWGMVQGITAAARMAPYAERRVELERAAVLLMPKPRGKAPAVVEV